MRDARAQGGAVSPRCYRQARRAAPRSARRHAGALIYIKMYVQWRFYCAFSTPNEDNPFSALSVMPHKAYVNKL